MNKALLALVTLFGVACSRQMEPTSEFKATGPTVRISVIQTGKILIDGKESTIAQVGLRLKQLKAENGIVLYHREAGDKEPPPVAMQVIKLVGDNRLPVFLSSKSDFSDYAGVDGQALPRK